MTTLPAPLSLSPSQFWDGNDGQWTSYILRLGGPQLQNVRVFPSTKSNYIWAIDPLGCPDGYYPGNDSTKDCEDSRGGTFAGNESVGWTELSVYKLHVDEDLGYDGANGRFGFDDVGLDYLGAGGNLHHQLIATTTDFWSGVLPLNPRPVNTSDMNRPQTSFLQSLKDANNISSLSWGYTAGAKYRSENFFGSLVLGGYDQARFDNKSQITVPFNADDEKDLTIQVNTISTNISSDPLTTAAMDLVIDSTIPYLYLPESSYRLFEKAFGLEWNDTVELYLINETHYDNLVKQSAELRFNVGTINTTEIVFPIAAFLLTAGFPLLGDDSSTSYYFPIKRTNDTKTLTLGRAFLQEAYIIYDYERSFFTLAPCIWPSDTAASPSSAPTIIPSVNQTSSHDDDNNTNNNTSDTSGLSAGAIAGAAIGGVIAGLLLATLLACIWLRRRRRRSRRTSQSTTSTSKFPPFSTTTSTPHTRHSSSTTLPPLSPRSGSRLASFFRNPWGSLSSEGWSSSQEQEHVHELAVDAAAPTPAELRAGERKRQRSSELDAEVCAVHEMFQPKAAEVPEMPGDGPLPTYVSGDGATIEGNVLRAAQQQRQQEDREAGLRVGLGMGGLGLGEGEEDRTGLLGARAGVYEMDATATATASPSSSALLSPLPSPGQLGAVARKEVEERERLEAERAEAERVRAREVARRARGGGDDGDDDGGDGGDTIESLGGVSRSSSAAAAAAAAAADRPDTERRVSDLSPISENSGFVMMSASRPDSGSRRVSRD
ncbi:hypothetical protein SLS58_003707 [Diplodia intermedia]|uniref:Peptidase A1 domain-containing protein n=1 Tax=Diplodia intermedia TaxID=856260 RepID=A0ABR3TVW3_9PEZI